VGISTGGGWFRPGGLHRLTAGVASLAIAAGLAGTALADPSPAAAPTPTAAGAPQAPFTGNVELKQRLDAAGPLVVASERLNRNLLQRFYADHGYRPVWDGRAPVVASLAKAVLAADLQGLDPALFHGAALNAPPANLSPVEHDLLLSDAFLSYADALARGAYPVEQRYDDEDLNPGPIDVVAAFDTAMSAADPGQALTALAPNSPEYQALQRAYVAARSGVAIGAPALPERGRAGRERARSEDVEQRHLRQLVVALERLRWLPRVMPRDRIVVNTASQMLVMYRGDESVFTTRVVVGMPDWQTPEFRSTVDSVLFNPPWNVPPSILKKEILPEIAANPDYLAQHHMRYRGPNRVEQEAGPYSALGRLKFEIDDRFDVYLHDTPEKFLFARGYRMDSHGCIRVQNPMVLANLLLDSTPQAIAKGIGVGYTHAQALPAPIPVFIVYETALVEPDGGIRFLADPYQRDDEVWDYLHRAGQMPVAQEGAAAQRKG
jgi:L,D-transpeptidase YcbB